MKHIGLFFGTFDPLHNGHVAIAKYFISELKLEELWLVVTPMNPFKEHEKVLNENKRLEMVSCFCDSNEKIICTDVEFHLPKPNYTADTLDYLVKKNLKTKFFVIIG
ncbi:MAG: adenylyltransferase/cytidyltransferase family protein, partial [Flavobacteriaceae bacterium]|nr:adenylyltransferase/cytidyltransferase family protein [Flavobacteriaceae bacterium]